MSDNKITFHFFKPETSKLSEKNGIPKKRGPNMFIVYRNKRMKDRPPNMTMTEFSKLVSKEWKMLSEEEKTELQRQYQINRDQVPNDEILERKIKFQRTKLQNENDDTTNTRKY